MLARAGRTGYGGRTRGKAMGIKGRERGCKPCHSKELPVARRRPGEVNQGAEAKAQSKRTQEQADGWTGFRDMLITAVVAVRSSMRDERWDGQMGRWADGHLCGVCEGETSAKEASAYPSEQLGVPSSLGARHGIDGRPSNCRWYGSGGVAAGGGDVAWSAVALQPGRDGRTVGSTTGPGPRCQDQGCDWRRRHADSGSARPPNQGASQASPRMGWVEMAKPLTGWVALVHLPRCYPGRVFDSWLVPPPRPNALACSSPRGHTLLDPCAHSPLSVLCGAIQSGAMRCDAMRCAAMRRDRNAGWTFWAVLWSRAVS